MLFLMYIHIYNYINTDVENYGWKSREGQKRVQRWAYISSWKVNETPPTFRSYIQIYRICNIRVCVCMRIYVLCLSHLQMIIVYKYVYVYIMRFMCVRLTPRAWVVAFLLQRLKRNEQNLSTRSLLIIDDDVTRQIHRGYCRFSPF